MEQFIEVHFEGVKLLINLRWVEKIRKNADGSASILFKSNQNYTKISENYSEILNKIWR